MADQIGTFLVLAVLQKAFDAAWDWAQIEIVYRLRRRGLSKHAEDIAHAFDVFSSRRMRPERYFIKKVGRVPRGEIQSIADAWAGGLNCILLVGSGGSGKSGIAHGLAQLLRRQGDPVLFIDAADVPSREDPVAYLGRILSLDGGFVTAFSILGREHDCYFIVDQLDSVSGRDSLLGFTNAIISLMALPRVRVLVVSRTYEAEQVMQIKVLPCERMTSDDLQQEEALRYLQILGIETPSQVIRDLAVNLLNLSLIADIVDAGGGFEGIASETDLWVRYVESIKEREGIDAFREALDLASQNPRSPGGILEGSLVPNRATRRLLSRGVLVSPYLGRLRFRHQRLRDFLCAYRLLPRSPSPSDVYREFGEQRARAIVIWLHSLLHKYDQDAEARFVDDALGQAAAELPFYTRTAVLDVLKEQTTPSSEVASRLAKHLKSEIYDRYFFANLTNPNWVLPLHAAGYFYEPPDPVETQPGYLRFPWWGGGVYLTRFAENYAEVLLDVACNVQSENASSLEVLLEGLVKIPARIAAGAAIHVAKWTPLFQGGFDPVGVGQFMGHLMDGKCVEEALVILSALYTPVIPRSEKSQQAINLGIVRVKAAVDEYWLRHIWRDYGGKLVKLVPEQVADLLEKNLVEALDLERESYGQPKGSETPSFWRPAIEEHEQNSSIYPLHDLLVDGLREAVRYICLNDSKTGEGILGRYLASNHSILRRIAIYMLAQFGSAYPQLLIQVCTTRANLDDSAIHHEFFSLLSEQFARLPVAIQSQLVNWFFDGPVNTAAVAARLVERVGPDKLEAELLRYREYWTLRRMWSIRQHLKDSDKDRFDDLCRTHGEPDHPDFLSWSSGVHAITHASPVSEQQMTALSLEKIIEELKKYAPPSPSIEHSRAGLAEALAGAVRADPTRLTGLAPLLIGKGVRFVYIYHYLGAMRVAIERGDQLDLSPILELCRYVASLLEDPYEQEKDRHEAGLRAAQFEIANLVEALLKQEKIDLDEEKEERLCGVIRLLLKNPDPEPDTELEPRRDPVSRSLDSVRGKAMHDVIEFARYQDKQARRQGAEQEHQPNLDPFVKEVLEQKLDKSADTSRAVHSVFGWYTPLIEYFDKDWLASNLARIFPDDPALEGFWRAAWDAYVSSNNVYKRPFLLLIPQYRRAISLLGEPEDPRRPGTTKGERLGEHLAFAYIHGLIDFESDDGLLQSFYATANDDSRGHVAFWLAKALGELELKADNSIWVRMWALMTRRLNVASESDRVEGFQDEVSSYMRWLEHTPVPFSDMEPFIRMTARFLKEGYSKKLVADYLARHAKEFPRQAIEIMHEVVQLAEAPWFSLYEDDLDGIIGPAVGSGDVRAISEAVAVINILGERGDFRWKKYLP